MIKFFGITHFTPKYLLETLENISDLDLEITILDSKSPYSEHNKEICLEFLSKKKIKRFVECSGNCKGLGLKYCALRFKSEDKFFIMSDMDVLDPSKKWLDLLTESMNEDYLLTGFSLDRSNYVPPNGGHSDFGFGFWFMGVNSKFYYEHGHNYTVDWKIRAAALPLGRINQLQHKLIHRGWDVWKDYPEYHNVKTRGINWAEPLPNITYTVHE